MAAATVLHSPANLGFKTLFQSAAADSEQRSPRGHLIPWKHKYSLLSTESDDAGDKARLILIPDGFYLWGLGIHVEDELDTGTNVLVYDIITETTAGVEDTIKLITGSTAGRAANEADRLDDIGFGRYVGDRYITRKVTTAANVAAAGDFWLSLLLSYGVGTFAMPPLSLSEV